MANLHIKRHSFAGKEDSEKPGGNPGWFGCFTFILCSFGESCWLPRSVHVAGVAWRTAMRIVAGVEDLMQRTGDGCTCRVLDGRAIERSGSDVCGLHRARGVEERGFLDRALKSRSTVYQWFDLKTTGIVFSDFASKPVGWFSLV
jgi:hypothetical protein